MTRTRFNFCNLVINILFLAGVSAAQEPPVAFQDDFADGERQWDSYLDGGKWIVQDGTWRTASTVDHAAQLARMEPAADVLFQADFSLKESIPRNFGIVLRAQADHRCIVLRYHDITESLRLLSVTGGRPKPMDCNVTAKLRLELGAWYTIKAAAVGEAIVAKMWPAEQKEPGWQFRAAAPIAEAGRVGLIAQDGTSIAVRKVRVWTRAAAGSLRETIAGQLDEQVRRVRDRLRIQIEPTPLVLRRPDAPARQVAVRVIADDKPQLITGRLTTTYAGVTENHEIRIADYVDGAYALLVPEPEEPRELAVSLAATLGGTIEGRFQIKPARRWTFYMTPHTHYDIGYTAPQPEVMDRLAREMNLAQEYCEQTRDWPEESRYRWTIEVTALMRVYAQRHSQAELDKLIEWVKDGRIEICGYYLNMPAEVLGHEEIIRCLYDAQKLRDRHGIRIDTAMINDVPGYGWCMPQLFVESGITRVSFRANSIRGQFIWSRPGAVPRPFYWQGPDGTRLFMWYTDSYRDGNFFRAPGLSESAFLSVIQRNEAAGYEFDDIQLRMGGDNLPPDINASINARAWNEKYIWPKVRVATNRDFLEHLETTYGSRCTTHSGDIPSWWAEGPASSAAENGIVRLLHDQLVAAEGLWTRAWLNDPKLEYPRQRFDAAYDKMIHFDEHTWGASESIREPRSQSTQVQWAWKAACAHDGRKMGEALLQEAVERLSADMASSAGNSFAVWNTLPWPRSDLVELPLAGTPLDGKAGFSVVDDRTHQAVPVQLSADGRTAFFVARDVPALSCLVFRTGSGEAATEPPAANDEPVLENDYYRLRLDPKRAAMVSWYDKLLNRELIDGTAEFQGNQPIYEISLDDRDAINKKLPSRFKRTTPQSGRLVKRSSGPIFSELVHETSLPTIPEIRQHVRLYKEFRMVDIANVVTKEEVFTPEGVYFAFPFDVPSPDFRFMIANTTMRPGKDQLPFSCQDFYSIQHWASIGGDGFSILFVPVDAPLVLASGLHAYQWKDRIDFDNGHLYSWIMNNYWHTNFRAGQSGTTAFRYRLTSQAGPNDPVQATRFAWQPFFPIRPVWLKSTQAPVRSAAGGGLLSIGGDPVIISCIKMAEDSEAIIVRLLELRGQASRSELRWNLPNGMVIERAYLADPVERPGPLLTVKNNAFTVESRPNQIVTVGIVVKRP